MRPCGRRPSCSRRRMSRRTTSAYMRAHYRCRRDLRLSGNSLQSQEGFTSGRPSLVDSPPAILHQVPIRLICLVLALDQRGRLLRRWRRRSSSARAASRSGSGHAPSRTRHSKTLRIRAGQSAIPHLGRSSGSISTAGSRSGTPPRGSGKRSCNASRSQPHGAAASRARRLSPSGRAVIALDGSTRRGECGVGGAEKLLFRLHDEADPVRPYETRRLLDARTPTQRSIWGGDDTCAIRGCRRPA